MDPAEMFSTDRTTFENELDLLMSAPPMSDSSVVTANSPLATKRPAVQEDISSKRTKMEEPSAKPEPMDVDSNDGRMELGRSGPSHMANMPVRSKNDKNHASSESTYSKRPVLQYAYTGGAPPKRSGQSQTGRILGDNARPQRDFQKNLDNKIWINPNRKEAPHHRDRYVPGKPKARTQRSTVFPLQRLPEDVMAKIFDYFLVGREPIVIDCYWLRSFIRGHARIPNVLQAVEVNGSAYTFPAGWNKLLADIDVMKDDMAPYKSALELRQAKTRHVRSPCRGLSTSLLRVSRKIHKTAAQVFYSKNTFKFPCATSAWIQLDSFLVTIGSQNAAKIQNLEVHPPMWHRSVQEDFVEGALMDVLSPATRMAVVKPPPRDRLVYAIQNACRILSPTLKTMELELTNTGEADSWSGRYVNDKRLISAAGADEHVQRKSKGVVLLKELSETLAANGKRPTLRVCRPKTTVSKREFQKQIPSSRAEAKKYGWLVETGSENVK